MDHIDIHHLRDWWQQEVELCQPQKLELGWKIHWMSMQGMSDVEIGHIQMFVFFPDQGECCWYLKWKIKGEPDQNERIYGYQADGYSQANSPSHFLQNGNLFALNCDPWWVSQSMVQVCGVSGNQNMCWARWSLPRIIPALGKWISRNSCSHLNCRFAISKVPDIWNNMPISNMDLKDWVLQDGKGTVNCSCLACLQQNTSASLLFLHTQSWRPWAVCMNCRTWWKAEHHGNKDRMGD